MYVNALKLHILKHRHLKHTQIAYSLIKLKILKTKRVERDFKEHLMEYTYQSHLSLCRSIFQKYMQNISKASKKLLVAD